MKKSLISIISLLMVAIMMLGLMAVTAIAEDDKEIVFWNMGTDGADKEVYDLAVSMFNELEPNGYHIKNVAVQNDNYKEKIVIAMSSNQCPDIYTSWGGCPMFEYIDSGFAQPVTDLVAGSIVEEKATVSAMNEGRYNGEIYGIPFFNVSLQGMFYNKDMFEKYGVEVPTTLAELEAAADVFLENGIVPFSLANESKWCGELYFMALLQRKGGAEPFRTSVTKEGTFENEAYIYAGQKIREWSEKGYFPEGCNSMSPDAGQDRQLMYQEKTAMLMSGSWQVGSFKNESEEFYQKIGWFSMPGIEGGADPNMQIGTMGDQFLQFNCTGEKREAAFELAKIMFSEEMTARLIESGKVPPVKGVEEFIEDPISKQILKAATDAEYFQLWYDIYLPPEVAAVHRDTVQALIDQSMTPEEAAAKVEAAMEEYLAKKDLTAK